MVPDQAAALLPGWEARADIVVVGSGVAGLTCAADAAAAGRSVLLVSKDAVDEGSTRWAQGGVAVVWGDRADPGSDSVAAHLADTVTAGAGLVDEAAAASILTDGPDAVRRLVAHGARFDGDPSGLLLRTREGGHHADRVIHAGGDATGAEIERALLAQLRGGLAGAPEPVVLADHLALDVLLDPTGRVGGLSVLGPDGRIGVVRAAAVVLATGGAGHLFAASTNPAVATADGWAMALRAGAELADVEFLQFHPTVLWTGPDGSGRRPLVTEAVRGEGAVLIDATGARIMPGVHPLADLAPRDVVSLAVTRRLALAPGGVGDHAYLDATGIPAATFHRRFPTVTAACAAAGIDPTRQPIPVAPAAHYACGGVRTDRDGRTSVPGLFAVGEVARTGLHGANRLASNSLLEGLVMGERAAEAANAAVVAAQRWSLQCAELLLTPAPAADPAGRAGLQAAMSAHAGIGRDAAGLAGTAALAAVVADTAPSSGRALDRDAVETANLAVAARAVLAAAAARTESRGCHVRTDHPEPDAAQAVSRTVRLIDGRPAVPTALAGV
ncbi:L-aspartate oxidase [Nakamurella sp. YIM 132084]|uniref:L-aspartate oxidase n=1 Tax=Nakamurella leprariae TaxID=2803911 RepID=A0A939C193_9ACTN|nr:L-aspartate oxidase [Nakamurella leprariae]